MFTQNDHYLKASFDEAQKRIRRILGCTIDVGTLDEAEKSEPTKDIEMGQKIENMRPD